MLPILIVEDHPLVAEATRRFLARQNQLIQVEVACDATSALREVDAPGKDWHRILLDLDVPGACGLSLAGELQKRNLAPRTCIVSATRRRDFVARVRDWGFLGYIVKASSLDDFEVSLRLILSGARVFPVDASPDGVSTPRLTDRQSEMLELVRSGMSSKNIAAHLHLTEGTVNNHIAAALLALRAASRAQAVARAIEVGLLRPGSSAIAADARVSSRRGEP